MSLPHDILGSRRKRESAPHQRRDPSRSLNPCRFRSHGSGGVRGRSSALANAPWGWRCGAVVAAWPARRDGFGVMVFLRGGAMVADGARTMLNTVPCLHGNRQIALWPWPFPRVTSCQVTYLLSSTADALGVHISMPDTIRRSDPAPPPVLAERHVQAITRAVEAAHSASTRRGLAPLRHMGGHRGPSATSSRSPFGRRVPRRPVRHRPLEGVPQPGSCRDPSPAPRSWVIRPDGKRGCSQGPARPRSATGASSAPPSRRPRGGG